MKKDIHPTYFPEAKIICACGKVYTAGSTREEIHVELCANCHPFFTGKQKLVDTAGRVEKFQRRYAKFQTQAPAAKAEEPAQAGKPESAAPAEAAASKPAAPQT